MRLWLRGRVTDEKEGVADYTHPQREARQARMSQSGQRAATGTGGWSGMRRGIAALVRPQTARGLAGLIVAGAVVLAAVGGGAYAAIFGGFGSGSSSSASIALQKGLVGWWRLNGNTNDSTPYRDDATISGSVTPAADQTGQPDAAYNFNGSASSYMTAITNMSAAPTTQISVSVWAMRSGAGSNSPRGILISRNSTYIDNCFSGKVLFSLYLTGGQELITGGSCSAVGDWHLYTATYDGTTARLYMDGTQIGSANYSGSLTSGDNILNLGRYNGGSYTFNGSLGDARLYNRALSATEVKALYTQYNSQANVASGEKGLVGWWKFDGSAKDSTPFRNNGVISGSVVAAPDRKGNANRAYAFGSDSFDYITAPLSVTSYPGLTLSAWINPSALPSERSTIIKGSAPNSYYMSLASDGSLQTYWYGRNPEGYFSSGAGTVPLNQWSFLTVTWDSSGAKLYVNGSLKATASSSGTGYVPTALTLGAESAARQFKGSIDDVRVYNQALSAGEITTIYSSYDSHVQLGGSGLAGDVNLTKGLIGQWNLDGNAHDATPYRNNGTVSGAVLTTDRGGNTAGAYSFPTSTSNISLGNIGNIGTGSFSVSAWFETTQSTSSGSLRGVVCKSLYGSQAGRYYLVQYRGNIESDFATSSTNYTVDVPEGPYIDGQWHLATVVFDRAGNESLYLDGVLKGSSNISSQSSLSMVTSDSLFIGAYNDSTGQAPASGTNYGGSIDDVRLYDRALSAAEVQALYNLYE